MPDEHPIEPSEPEQSAPAEQSARSGQSGQPAPDDAAAEQEPSPGPRETPRDAGGASAADAGGASAADAGGASAADAGGASAADAGGASAADAGGASAPADAGGASAADAGEAGAEGAPAGEAGAREESADDDAVAAELEEAARQRDAHYERLLRVTAEFDNYRKRTERERRELIDQAAGDLLGDLLPVVDDLERALAADTQDGDAYRRGVEIIHKQLLDVMARRGVAPIEAVGADFDPTLHQAVAHEAGDGRRDGEVVEELRRGYTLRQRLLRPSMVKVAKA